jgi:hypothetical protein
MVRDDLNTMAAFRVIAEERSFTKAANRLGVSPSAMSHVIRELEEGLGVRLLSPTTRQPRLENNSSRAGALPSSRPCGYEVRAVHSRQPHDLNSTPHGPANHADSEWTVAHPEVGPQLRGIIPKQLPLVYQSQKVQTTAELRTTLTL